MARIQRFDFGTLRDFRGPIVLQTMRDQVEEAPPPPPPPPTYSEADLEAARLSARKQGFSEGFLAGEREAAQKFDALTSQSNSMIETLGSLLTSIEKRYAELVQKESQQLPQLISVIARKVAGDAMSQRGEQEIIAMVERCLPVIFGKPKLTIELNPKILERAQSRIESTLQTAGYEGQVQFKTNNTLAISDVTLDWVTGSATRSAAELWQEIDTLIDRIPLEITFQETLTQETTNP